MKHRIVQIWAIAMALLLSACGGGGSGGGGSAPVPGPAPAPPPDPGPTAPPPPANQSPGGIWSGFTAAGDATFYITEEGELHFSADIPGGLLILGAGTVEISNGDELAGELQAGRILPEPSASSPPGLICSLDGALTERAQIDLAVECEDAGGPAWNETLSLTYSKDYEQPSSLDRIASGYRLAFGPAAETLNLDGDEVSGEYHNGLNCTVKGQVSPRDPSYNLYWVEWTMSNCLAPFPNYEGAEFMGIASIIPSTLDEAPMGSIHIFLTAEVAGRFDFLSVIYEPA